MYIIHLFVIYLPLVKLIAKVNITSFFSGLKQTLLFAFSTSITWCYYGDRSTAYIFGEKGVVWYRNFYVLCFVLAAVIDTTVVWNIAYVVVALVSIPNLIAMFVLRKEMKSLSDNFDIK